MTTPAVPLIAHYADKAGIRQLSLRVIAINSQNVMLVLWENKLVPVHAIIPGLTLDRVEILTEPVPKAEPKAKKTVDEVK